MTNINPQTGVRYGVISARALNPEVIDRIEREGINLTEEQVRNHLRDEVQRVVDLGTLPQADFDDEVDRRLEEWSESIEECVYRFTEGNSDNPDLCVQTGWLGGAQLVWVFRSPHVARARLCSPCVPNAGDLDNLDSEDGVECYDVPPEWRWKEEKNDNALLTPAELAVACDGGEYAAYPRAEWQSAVDNNDTALDYWEWVHRSLAEEAVDSVRA